MSDEKKWRIVCNLEFGYTAADILTLRRSQISRHLLGPLRNSFLKEQEPTSSGTHICGIIIIQLKKSHQLYPIQENQMQAPQTEQEKKATLANEKSCRCPVFRIVFFTVLLIGAVSGLSLVFTGSSNPLDYFVPVDPPGEAEAYRWDAESGLELMVENACDPSWTTTFDKSIADWNVSESLNLRTQQIPYEFDCDPSYGRLKVCNGDYGETFWRGINTVLIQNGVIVYSNSKLNDFYTKSRDQKLYTMCHENGHGFGLPHTDEDHFNRDRGDCMDYTNRPGNNLDPGDFNFVLLNTLYGTPDSPLFPIESFESSDEQGLPSPRVNTGDQTSPGNDVNQRPDPQGEEEDKKKEKEKEGDRRLLRGLVGTPQSVVTEVPKICLERARSAEALCDSEHCINDVGYGYTVLIHKLLV